MSLMASRCMLINSLSSEKILNAPATGSAIPNNAMIGNAMCGPVMRYQINKTGMVIMSTLRILNVVLLKGRADRGSSQ